MPRREPLDLTPPTPPAHMAGLLAFKAKNRPNPPYDVRTTISTRIDPQLARWVQHTADLHGLTRSQYMARLLRREMDAGDDGWPWDVSDWLLQQAAACGVPGDLEAAVVLIVRHLAKLYPHGAELLDPDETP